MKHLVYTFIVILSISCTTSIDNSNKSYYIDLDKTQMVKTKDLFSKIEIITLETNEQSLIQAISKIVEYKSRLYILDSRQKAILIFDNTGKFIAKIHSVGRAPEEYSLLYDISINTYSNTLEGVDPMGKILTYDLDGNYISSIYLPHPPMAYHAITILNKDSILLHTKPSLIEDYTFRIYSRKSDSIVSKFNKQKEAIFWRIQSPLQIYKDTIYYSQATYNQIFQVINDTVINAYNWDLGKYTYDLKHMKIPDLTDPVQQMKFYKEVMYSAKIPYTFGFNGQNDQYYYSSIFMKERMINIFYNKESKEKIIFSNTKEGIGIFPIIIDNEKIIGITNEDWVPLSSLTKAKNASIINQEILKNITDNSNPILIKYIFK